MVRVFKDVGFGGKNSEFFLNSTFFGYAAQLLMRKMIDLDFAYSSLFHSHSQVQNMFEVVHAILFTW